MENHSILPQGADEIRLVEERILALSGTVLTVAEWLNLMAAAGTALPRQNGKQKNPSDVDLMALRDKPQMRLFAALLRAIGAEGTYNNNRRYTLLEWARLVERFAELSVYVVPPARLEYAADLCQHAIRAATKTPWESILLMNALSEVDIRVVRQLVSAQVLNEWSEILEGTIKENCEIGEDIEARSDDLDLPSESDEPSLRDKYDQWSSESEETIAAATGFYGWSGRQEPADLSQLRELTSRVDRPPYPDTSDEDDREYGRSTSPSSYWTLERMFEDL
ncbi:MAG: hypothetical protein ABSH47_00775 [Bryobacteraceae bacterium]|jgi:hypothetical protein